MKQIRMTRNEYKDYVRKCISRASDPNDPYSWADYKNIDNSVEILPLDLSDYPAIRVETAERINKWFDEEDVDRNENYMLRGFTGSDNFGLADKEMSLLNIEPHYPSAYSFYGFNDTELLIYTWCEGDTTLTLFKDRIKYEVAKAETIAWYKEAYQ